MRLCIVHQISWMHINYCWTWTVKASGGGDAKEGIEKWQSIAVWMIAAASFAVAAALMLYYLSVPHRLIKANRANRIWDNGNCEEHLDCFQISDRHRRSSHSSTIAFRVNRNLRQGLLLIISCAQVWLTCLLFQDDLFLLCLFSFSFASLNGLPFCFCTTAD